MSNLVFALALFGVVVSIIVVGTGLIILIALAFGAIEREYKMFRDGRKKIIDLHAEIIKKHQENEQLREQLKEKRAGYR